MKKWLIMIIIVGLLGWAVYDYIDSKEAAKENEELASVDTLNQDDTSEFVGLNVGETAPDFELETMAGETVRLSDLRGEKVMVNFWASWCPPCKAEMPDIQKFHEDEAGTIVSVNLTETETNEQQVTDFVDENDLTFPILMDRQSKVATLYTAQALPTSYLIDSEGKIDNIAIGQLNYQQLVNGFDEMD